MPAIDLEKEAKSLDSKVRRLILKFGEEIGLDEVEADQLLSLATNFTDVSSRKMLKARISELSLKHPEAAQDLEDFYKLAFWISMKGTSGLESIVRYFGVDYEGNVFRKFRNPTLQKLASLSIRLAQHPWHREQNSFVKGTILRTDPRDPSKAFNPSHQDRLEFARTLVDQRKIPLGKEDWSKIMDQSIEGLRKEEVYLQGFLDSLMDWAESIAGAMKGARQVLHRKVMDKAQQFEAQHFRLIEDIVHEMASKADYSGNYNLDDLLAAFRAAFPPLDPPKDTKLPVRNYVTLLDEVEDLTPVERSYYVGRVLARFLHYAYEELSPEDRKVFNYVFSALIVHLDFHRNSLTPKEFAELADLIPELQEVEAWLTDEEAYLVDLTDIALRHLGNKVHSVYNLLQSQYGVLHGAAEDLQKMVDDLLMSSIEPSERKRLLEIKKDSIYLRVGGSWLSEKQKPGEPVKFNRLYLMLFLFLNERRKKRVPRWKIMHLRNFLYEKLATFLKRDMVP